MASALAAPPSPILACLADLALLASDEGGRYTGPYRCVYCYEFDDDTGAREFRERAKLVAGVRHGFDVETELRRVRVGLPYSVTVRLDTLTDVLLDIATAAVPR